MSVVSSAQRNALYSQHSLDSHDWQLICQLAELNGLSDAQTQQLTSLTFEQFFSLAVHTFITAKSPTTRQQLAALLPKFGSRAVLSLFKILLLGDALSQPSMRPTAQGLSELKALSQESLKKIEPTAFVVGLESVLSDEKIDGLMPLVLDVLASVTRKENGVILTLLPRLLSAESWQKLKKNLLTFPTFSTIQTSLQAQQRKSVLAQAVMHSAARVENARAENARAENARAENASLDSLSCQLVDAPASAISA